MADTHTEAQQYLKQLYKEGFRPLRVIVEKKKGTMTIADHAEEIRDYLEKHKTVLQERYDADFASAEALVLDEARHATPPAPEPASQSFAEFILRDVRGRWFYGYRIFDPVFTWERKLAASMALEDSLRIAADLKALGFDVIQETR